MEVLEILPLMQSQKLWKDILYGKNQKSGLKVSGRTLISRIFQNLNKSEIDPLELWLYNDLKTKMEKFKTLVQENANGEDNYV